MLMLELKGVKKIGIFSCEIMKAFLSVTISLLQGDNIDVAGHDRLFFFILFYINTTFPMCSIKGGIKVITGPDGRTGHLGNEMGFFLKSFQTNAVKRCELTGFIHFSGFVSQRE